MDEANLVLAGHGQLWHCKTHEVHRFQCEEVGDGLCGTYRDPHGMSVPPGLLCITALQRRLDTSGRGRSASSI